MPSRNQRLENEQGNGRPVGAGKERQVMTKRTFLLVLALMIAIASCNCNGVVPAVDCSRQGSSSIFVANFDDDAVGSMPTPSTPLHYGPPGASLDMQDGSNTIEVVNSAALGSQALRITRYSEIDAVVGDVGDAPYSSGMYFIEFKAHGEVVPEPLIAGVAISVTSAAGQSALELKLHDAAYHLWEGDSYLSLDGSYDPSAPHFVHIELNLDARNYSVCIDEEVVASYKALVTQDFGNLHSLKFLAPPTITEAFEMVYVVDEIRITK